MTEYVTLKKFNKTLEEKFAIHNLELDTKFDMILKKLEELKPTNTYPPIRETQNTNSSVTHTEQKLPIDIDESETQPYKRNTLQTPTKSRSHKDDSFEDYDSDEEVMVEVDQVKRWSDDKHLKEGQQQVQYGALPKYKVKADIPNFNGMFKIEELLDWLCEVESFFQFMDVPDDAQLKMVVYKLKGGALAWWENLCEERTNAWKPPIMTWKRIRFLIHQKFLPRDFK
ncbi:hypothetical protein ACOSP7_004642 [Xanthoceras sorbifolium]